MKKSRPKQGVLRSESSNPGPVIDFKSFRIVQCAAKFLGGPKPTSLSQDMSLNGSFSKEDKVWKYEAHFRVHSSKEVGNDTFEVSATYQVSFTFDRDNEKPFTKDSSEMEKLVVRVLWPYWREFVYTITGKLGLSSLQLPMIFPEQLEFKPRRRFVKSPRSVAKRKK